MSPKLSLCALVVLVAFAAACPVLAGGAPIESSLDAVATVEAPPLDLAAIAAEDAVREAQGEAPRYAIPNATLIRPSTDGTWDDLDSQTRRWRVRITSPGAVSLNLGFTAYSLPIGAKLRIYAADGSYELRPFTAADNSEHGELWTPVVLSDDIVVELLVARESADMVVLELTSINIGYRGFQELMGERAGSCNIDVICSQGDGWRNEIPAIAVISTGGSLFCTGFMVNNTAQDQTPYFMTAYHCGVSSSNAASLVVYWNYFSPTCGQHGGGSLSQFQTGSYFRARWSTSDFCLVELDEDPNPAWAITFAGWDRTTADPTSAVCIHHPSCDEKSISFDYGACPTTSYLGSTSPGDGTHIKTDWDLGVTENGSSGSPLFNQAHRVVGQLHGGYSACNSSDMRDWYGRFSKSWAGGGSSTNRLSNWLDAGGTGATTMDTLVPGVAGMAVTPSDGLSSSGSPGGPFSPVSKSYTLQNQGSSALSYSVTKTVAWLTITNPTGTIPGSGSVTVTVSINSNANSLSAGSYSDTVSFVNNTNHSGDTTRPVTLQVGSLTPVYSFPMDSNPGWTTQGLWAFGDPTAGGGTEHGYPDPSAGHTGSNVYGYNLSGDYEPNIPERHLTSTAINCTGMTGCTLKFWRWLNVERSTYDHAYVRVSNNGSTWTTLWQNPDSHVESNSWTQDTFDISSVADNQATVYLRWTMGTTDGSWQYSGWNLDDVEIWAYAPCTPPSITGHPQGLTRCTGQSATFNVTATGTATLTYQWRKGGNNIGGATGSSYTISSVLAGDAGSYDCVVTNSCGSATSNAATLTVTLPPTINSNPTSLVRCAGLSATFAVTASGTPTLYYQWRKGGNNIGGATGSSYTISSVVAGNAGSYDCVVSNGCGSATSSAATLTVTFAPSITGHPQSQSVTVGSPMTLSVTATGTPTLYYQWRKNGGDIGGAISSTYYLPSATLGDAGNYDCVVGNGCGTATSNVAVVSVSPAICRGDCNCDHTVGFPDIDYFVAALPNNQAGWVAMFAPGSPSCTFANCDVNGNGTVGFDDIDPFVAILPSACP